MDIELKEIKLKEPTYSSLQITKENIKDIADYLGEKYMYFRGTEHITFNDGEAKVDDWVVKTRTPFGLNSFEVYQSPRYRVMFGENQEIKNLENRVKDLEVELGLLNYKINNPKN